MELELPKFSRISSVLTFALLNHFICHDYLYLRALKCVSKAFFFSFLAWWKQHLFFFVAHTAVQWLFMWPYVKKKSCKFASFVWAQEPMWINQCTRAHTRKARSSAFVLLLCCVSIRSNVEKHIYTCTLLFVRQISFSLTLVAHFARSPYCWSMNWETIKINPKA